MTGVVAAVDLGATSGRVMLGRVGANELSLRQLARFPNGPVPTEDGLRWDVTGLYGEALDGLAAAIRDEPELLSIGVDSWAVDYALMRNGRMLAEPHHYRDARTEPAVDAVHGLVDPADLYAANGLQHLPFTTLYQLSADSPEVLAEADGLLLIPDLLNFWLTGRVGAEVTNASTTGLLGVTTRRWDDSLIRRLGLPRRLLPELVEAGTAIGALLPGVAAQIGAGPGVVVTAVGSHDTASAVVAVPSTTDDFAYISCGTWGLVGVELEAPVLTEAGRRANFTNELGVDGRVRYLHNVMGLWLLSESVREWEHDGSPIDLPSLLDAAAQVTSPIILFDVDDPRFLPPGSMPTRIAEWCAEHGVAAPTTRVEFVRSIVESLAEAFARAVDRASELSGKPVSVIHIVGGGSQNTLLCQLTADRSGRPVLAGPVEATALGNVLVQARAQGLVSGDLSTLRALVARVSSQARYLPR
jgi:rhamnulokinase